MMNILFRGTDRELLNKAIEELIRAEGYTHMNKILLATHRTIVDNLRESGSIKLVDVITPSKAISEELYKVEETICSHIANNEKCILLVNFLGLISDESLNALGELSKKYKANLSIIATEFISKFDDSKEKQSDVTDEVIKVLNISKIYNVITDSEGRVCFTESDKPNNLFQEIFEEFFSGK